MNFYKVETPNGDVFTRNSKKEYTFAAFIEESNGLYTFVGFSSTKDLAIKAAKQQINWLIPIWKKDAEYLKYKNPERYLEIKANIVEEIEFAANRNPIAIQVEKTVA